MKLDLSKLPSFLQNPDPRIYLSGNFTVLDFETTNLDKGTPKNPDNHIVCASWEKWSSGKRSKSVLQFQNEYNLSELIEDIESSDFIVAFASSFEVGWLRRAGAEIRRILPFCTQLAEWVIAGNRGWGRRANLNDTLQRYGLKGKEHGISDLIRSGFNPDDMSPTLLGYYCQLDVARTRELFFKQLEILVRDNLLATAFTRNIFIPPKVDIESRGMHLDESRVNKVHRYLLAKKKQLESDFNELTGGFNYRSTAQKREYIYDILKFEVPHHGTTPKGIPKTDAPTLGRLKAKTKKQRQFISLLQGLSRVEAQLSKSLSKFKACVDETVDKILTATINQTTTATHRLSSSGEKYKAQFQNFDREFKPCFSARFPGWKVAELDQAGLEFNIAAQISPCNSAIKFIKSGNDPHQFSGEIIYKNQWKFDEHAKSPANGPLRQAAKAFTFKPLFGGNSGTPRERAYYQAFRDKFPGVVDAQNRWKKEVLDTGRLVTCTGLIFYWPDTKITNTGYITNTTAICNYPVQSFAGAEVVPVAVTYHWHLLQVYELQSFIVNTVHDSDIGEVHPDEEELYKELGVQAFTDIPQWYMKQVYDIDFLLDLKVEYTSSEHWNDLKDWEDKWKAL